jgi:hypothetical protein
MDISSATNKGCFKHKNYRLGGADRPIKRLKGKVKRYTAGIPTVLSQLTGPDEGLFTFAF